MNEVRENEINEAKGLNNDVEDIEADFDSELDSRYDDYLNGKNCMEVNYGGEPGEYEYGQDKYGKYAYGIYKEGATSEMMPPTTRCWMVLQSGQLTAVISCRKRPRPS